MTLQLPPVLVAGCPAYPCTPAGDDVQWLQNRDCSFTWQRNCGDGEWEVVGKNGVYRTSEQDADHRLRLTCTLPSGSQVSAESGPVLPAPAGPCPMAARHALTKQLTNSESVRVVSYNILSEIYAAKDVASYPYCPEHALHINYRKSLLLKELLGYRADLLCLQEVDSAVFTGDLTPVLWDSGLSGVHATKAAGLTEGPALFWRRDKLRVVEWERIVLSDVIQKDPLFCDVKQACENNQKLKKDLLSLPQVLQLAVFECVAARVAPGGSDTHQQLAGRRLVVANTHLYWSEDAEHLRALQAGVCLRIIENRLRPKPEGNVTSGNNAPSLIFCGDFNSVPTGSVYRLVTSLCLTNLYAEDEPVVDGSGAPLSLRHGLTLDSACGTPEYTNIDLWYRLTLDYMFYTADSLKVRQVVPLPCDADVTRHTALPSVSLPSDHLALVADLTWSDLT